MKRSFGGLGLVMAVLGATLFLASPAFAWSSTLTGSAACNQQTGKFDITWHVVNDEPGNAMTVETASGSGLPANLVGADVPAGGSIDRTLSGQAPGTYSLTIGVTWDGSAETDSATNTVEASGTCAPAAATTTTTTSTTSTTAAPTTTTTSAGLTAGTVETTSTTVAVKDASITEPTVFGEVVAKQPVATKAAGKPSTSPATLPRTGDFRTLPLATIGLVLVALGLSVFAIGARRQQDFAEVSARLRSLR